MIIKDEDVCLREVETPDLTNIGFWSSGLLIPCRWGLSLSDCVEPAEQNGCFSL
jgi:hypothetical protein